MSDFKTGGVPIPDYEQDEVSKKVLKIVVSYIDYVNRTVWSFEPKNN